MCGICGYMKDHGAVDTALFDRLVDALEHRGPDDRGTFIKDGRAIGMRRLSIIDIESGRQPMCNEDGSIYVVYNGEIYNHMELRRELLAHGHIFRTDHSDTEVLLHGYEQWGIEGLAKRLNGIYAFAILDIPADTIFLVRDRFGVKPLYYVHRDGAFLFASEIKPLLLSGLVSTSLSEEALAFYLRYQFVPGSQTILKDVRKLLPAQILEYRNRRIRTCIYWDLQRSTSTVRTLDECAEELKELLVDTVERQMMSDVPIGVFLSGGLDSTIIAYLMAMHSERPVRSYSIVFPGEKGFDESHFSSKVAGEISSEHTVITFDEERVLEVIEDVIKSMDEPVADPAMVPTYYMAREAAKDVKVILTGEGADEVFAGYPYYRQFVERGRFLRDRYLSPGVIKKAMRSIFNRILLFKEFGPAAGDIELPPSSRFSGFPLAMSDYILSLLLKDAGVELIERLNLYEAEVASHVGEVSPLQRALYVDTKLWLAENLMLKLDRMTMAHSLEARVPFLDHRVVELAFNMPDTFKVGPCNGKLILRKAMKDTIHFDIVNRTKQGFNLPFPAWFKNRLRNFVHDSLSKENVDALGFIEYDTVKRLIRCHMKYGMNAARPLWMLIVLSLWNQHVRNLAGGKDV